MELSFSTDVNANFNRQLSEVSYFHYTCPSLNASLKLNEHDELIKNYVYKYNDLAYESTFCEPAVAPTFLSEKYLLGNDPVAELVNEKETWEVSRDELVKTHVKSRKHKVFTKKFKGVTKVLSSIATLAEHLGKDPDPNFSGFYNWYYTDGCLNKLLHCNSYSLLHTRSNTRGKIELVPLRITKSNCIPLEEKSVVLKTGCKQPIFQVGVENNFIIARQKNYTSLFTIVDDDELKFKKIHKHSEIQDSIVNVSISNSTEGEYASLTSSHTLKLWSPETKNECTAHAVVKENCKKPCDHWGSVKYVFNNCLLVSTRDCVYLKDPRIKLRKSVQKWKPNLNNLSCDNVTMLLTSSCQDSTAYIGTTHYLYELDLRQGLSKMWTHRLEFPPMYGLSYPVSDSGEMLFIGSQNVNEVCLIDAGLHVMPYILPSPEETLSKVNQQGICLNPDVSCRFNFSMTGITAIPGGLNNSNTFVFRSTSVGDLFYQELVPRDRFDDYRDINYNNILKWEDECTKCIEKSPTTPLKVTDVIDFHKLFKIDKKQLAKILKDRSNRSNSKSKKNPEASWKISKHKLVKSRNDIEKQLLDVWNIDEPGEWKKVGKGTKKVNVKDVTSTEPQMAETSSYNISALHGSISKQSCNNNISDDDDDDDDDYEPVSTNNSVVISRPGGSLIEKPSMNTAVLGQHSIFFDMDMDESRHFNSGDYIETNHEETPNKNSANLLTLKRNVKPPSTKKKKFTGGF